MQPHSVRAAIGRRRGESERAAAEELGCRSEAGDSWLSRVLAGPRTCPSTTWAASPALGPGTGLLAATAEEDARRAGWPLRLGHVLAWHVRTALGDALWRSQAGIPLPRGTPPGYVDELAAQLAP